MSPTAPIARALAGTLCYRTLPVSRTQGYHPGDRRDHPAQPEASVRLHEAPRLRRQAGVYSAGRLEARRRCWRRPCGSAVGAALGDAGAARPFSQFLESRKSSGPSADGRMANAGPSFRRRGRSKHAVQSSGPLTKRWRSRGRARLGCRRGRSRAVAAGLGVGIARAGQGGRGIHRPRPVRSPAQ